MQGDDGFGIDPSILDRMALEIKELIDMGVEVGVVLGGGNLFRGAKLAKAGMNRVVGDHMGMLATVMNGLAMRDSLFRADVNAKLMSAFQLNGICDTYNWSEAIKMLREKRVVIFSGGTGSPFFTKVDGVYDCDPAKNPDAVLYSHLSYADVIDRELQVMDLAAFTLARDHGMPIRVFNMGKPGALRRVITGEQEGTLICAKD